MSSRGRGYGRGYGGTPRSGGGGYRGGYRGSSSRGSYDSRGGRGGSSYSSSYDKYGSGSRDRYVGKYEREETFKKPYKSYQQESSSNYGSSSREYSRGISPERKRMRMEGSSDRRSHEYGGGSSYSRQEPSYSSSERRSYNEERRRSEPRDSYRKSMRSPAPMRGRGTSVRRSTRGRPMRSRGTFRSSVIRSRGTYIKPLMRKLRAPPFDYKSVRPLVSKLRSIKGKDGEDGGSTTEGEEDWDADEKKTVASGEEKKTKAKSDETPKKDTSTAEGEEADTAAGDKGSEGSATDKEGVAGSGDEVEDEDEPPQITKKPVSYFCVHCQESGKSVMQYARHLSSMRHKAVLNEIAVNYRRKLLKMRAFQRNKQRELEGKPGVKLLSETSYCPICRLNYRTSKSDHTQSGPHKEMRKIFAKRCLPCALFFRSPIIYEHHICSIEHHKKKRVVLEPSEAGSDPGADVDLQNFMTLDSVGDVDEVEDEEEENENGAAGAEDAEGDGAKKDDKLKKPKQEINIGSEHIKKVQVLYCDICNSFLERNPNQSAEGDNLIRRHCRMRFHLSRYVKYRDTKTLRKHAERIHRQLHKAKENKSSTATVEVKTEETSEKGEQPTENGSITETAEEKLWADVDELLADAGNKSSDDDDELDRYDKFRKSSTEKETEVTEPPPPVISEAVA